MFANRLLIEIVNLLLLVQWLMNVTVLQVHETLQNYRQVVF